MKKCVYVCAGGVILFTDSIISTNIKGYQIHALTR